MVQYIYNSYGLLLFSHSVAILCTSLAPDVNGVIIFAPDSTEPFDFQTTATYGCNEGFFLLGNANYDTRWCDGDGLSTSGVWNSTAPSCSGETSFIPYYYREKFNEYSPLCFLIWSLGHGYYINDVASTAY